MKESGRKTGEKEGEIRENRENKVRSNKYKI
jgi:hypothetical protein